MVASKKYKIYRLIPLLYDLKLEYRLNGCKKSRIIYRIKYKNMDAEFKVSLDEWYFVEAFIDYKRQYLHWRKTPNHIISRDPLLLDSIEDCIINLKENKICN